MPDLSLSTFPEDADDAPDPDGIPAELMELYVELDAQPGDTEQQIVELRQLAGVELEPGADENEDEDEDGVKIVITGRRVKLVGRIVGLRLEVTDD